MSNLFSLGRTYTLLAVSAVALSLAGLIAAGANTRAADADLATVAATSEAATTAPLTQEATSRGPGSFDLTVPALGLTGLTSYVATLQMHFTGTEQGQLADWTRSLRLAVDQNSKTYLWTLDSTAPTDKAVSAVIDGQIAGVRYSRLRKEDACSGTPVNANDTAPSPSEPAEWLPPVLGAETAGPTVTVNGLATNHYRFDETALDLVGLATASGEVWVATSGGEVVKYLLTTQGSSDYFGQGIAGKQSWDYELTTVNQPLVIQPPPGCPPGLLTIPLPTDAAEAVQEPGLTTYSSASDVKTLAAFYQKTLPAAGWKAGQMLIATGEALLTFTQGQQSLSIQIIAGKPTIVSVELSLAQAATATPTGARPAPTRAGKTPTAHA